MMTGSWTPNGAESSDQVKYPLRVPLKRTSIVCGIRLR